MRANRWVVTAAVVAILAALVVAFAPLGSIEETTATSGGSGGVTTFARSSLLATEGVWILIVVSVPVLVALVPVFVQRRTARIVSAVLLWIGCVIALASIGMFFIPAAIAMTVAAARHEPTSVATG
jgi:hypothetical protein